MIRTLWNDYLVGTPFERALLVRRRSAAWLQAGIIFVHIPKAAGTSLSHMLYGRFLGHLRAADVKRWSSPAVRRLPLLAVTRNPWDRLVSAYRFVKRGAGLGPNAGAVWRPELYHGPKFETFERFVGEWLPGRDLEKLDFVFQPQSAFVFDSNGRNLVEHIGRFEDLEPTWHFLEARLPGLRRFPRSNHSGVPVNYRTFYTPRLVDQVQSIYSDDIKRFGYSFE